MGIEDESHAFQSPAAKAGACGSKLGPRVIVPARKPAVGLPGVSDLGERIARAGLAGLCACFGAGFLAWRLVNVLMLAGCATGQGKARTRGRKRGLAEFINWSRNSTA